MLTTSSSTSGMIRELSTNWGKLDPTVPDKDKVDQWVPWKDTTSTCPVS
jgi:hypothetical protein